MEFNYCVYAKLKLSRNLNKWLKESHEEVKHYFDVWHVVKGELDRYLPLLSYDSSLLGLRKKLEKLAKVKDCSSFGE